MHADAPPPEEVPAGQLSQTCEVTAPVDAEYLPAGQLLQLVDSEDKLKYPCGQIPQLADPWLGAYQPIEHSTHEEEAEAPDNDEYLPVLHRAHSEDRTAFVELRYVPAEQAKQDTR